MDVVLTRARWRLVGAVAAVVAPVAERVQVDAAPGRAAELRHRAVGRRRVQQREQRHHGRRRPAHPSHKITHSICVRARDNDVPRKPVLSIMSTVASRQRVIRHRGITSSRLGERIERDADSLAAGPRIVGALPVRRRRHRAKTSASSPSLCARSARERRPEIDGNESAAPKKIIKINKRPRRRIKGRLKRPAPA